MNRISGLEGYLAFFNIPFRIPFSLILFMIRNCLMTNIIIINFFNISRLLFASLKKSTNLLYSLSKRICLYMFFICIWCLYSYHNVSSFIVTIAVKFLRGRAVFPDWFHFVLEQAVLVTICHTLDNLLEINSSRTS